VRQLLERRRAARRGAGGSGLPERIDDDGD